MFERKCEAPDTVIAQERAPATGRMLVVTYGISAGFRIVIISPTRANLHRA